MDQQILSQHLVAHCINKKLEEEKMRGYTGQNGRKEGKQYPTTTFTPIVRK